MSDDRVMLDIEACYVVPFLIISRYNIMRCCLLSFLTLIVVTVLACADDEKQPLPLKPGGDLPGPFRPYNVTGKYGERSVKEVGGKDKEVEGQFHCLVCDHGLNPVAMVFVRNPDLTRPQEGLIELLKQLNIAVQRHRKARLGSFAVFLSDDLPDVVAGDDKNDAKRAELAAKLKDAVDKPAELNNGENLVLALESKKYIPHYPLDDDALATVVLFNEHRIVAVFPLKQELLDNKEQATKEFGRIMQAIAKMTTKSVK